MATIAEITEILNEADWRYSYCSMVDRYKMERCVDYMNNESFTEDEVREFIEDNQVSLDDDALEICKQYSTEFAVSKLHKAGLFEELYDENAGLEIY